MTSTPDVGLALDSLLQRLRAVAPTLLPGRDISALNHGPLLAALADAVAETPTDDAVWILGTAVAAGYPTATEVSAIRRRLVLASPADRSGAVMAGVAVTASAVRSDGVTAEVVTVPVVDVDFCAKHAHNTGIQRVVRNTVPWWSHRDVPPVLLAWSPDGTGYRRLTEHQNELVLRWSSNLPASVEDTNDQTLVIPVGTTVLLPEVPAHEYIERLISIARNSGNRVGLIGYDAIPIVSADSMLEAESDRFSAYLGIVKHASIISCISAATAEEFRGFRSGLPAQGLTGPEVEPLPLPVAPTASAAPAIRRTSTRPLVLMVGSLEPRKNQLGVLSAARILWARGVDFELQFIGGGSAWFLADFERDVAALARQGHHVSIGRGFSDDQLAAAYGAARVVAFPSLQEGYGLPVAEALATGTPVVTTRYGSTAEIAAQGGCLLVDPRDDDDIANAIERVLLDEPTHDRLVAEALARTNVTWPDYADALWTQLVGGTA